ncbi:hypothetical protein EAX61_01285 [Dokdonia sinensis]|uniref:Carboxypeptidase-like regulatory domain-containing protein n=1 Tax=Dokdonia sinensis TaxID=2479847 RepID=A0A3M0GMT5_9FLAO|nr:carboxypeptidase-like regulatory domain-containing protein [Dokdonia sinensis]RMB64042.1 hypothetical protein EAX61_01285 [Dokdonia sinensis]
MKTQIITMQQNVAKTMLAFCLVLSLGLISNTASAQTTERTVTGVVSSAYENVAYATVSLKGAYIATSTDEKGAFTFPQMLKEGDVLTVSSLGYQDREVTITGDTTFIKPFLEEIPLIITAALRTAPSGKATDLPNN